ncbi:pirin family protein [Enemella sp. A6]|uniref:pirin family protein n=1 Tax=Enemella sp. A6 TaxID=3440152 RepID=UPI003EBA1C08
MSNPEEHPQEFVGGAPHHQAPIKVLGAREVPLGGVRAMTVRRTIPHRELRMIGAWCFLDHYGPDDVASTGGMAVARHPHTGLSTVSWLFTGEIDHLDSAGNRARVRPGELNLMTAGRGISHSEFSTTDTTVLHGAQLWLAAPNHTRDAEPRFDHYRPEPTPIAGGTARVFLGDWLGARSPIEYPVPVVGAEIVLDPGARWNAPLSPDFEYGFLLDTGTVRISHRALDEHDLAYVSPGGAELPIEAGASGARLLVIGGEPFAEKIVMWWNFIGRSHDEIVAYRARWQAEMTADIDSARDTELFGPFPPDTPAPIAAPPLPNSRLVSRN